MKFETVAKEVFDRSIVPNKWREIGELLKSGECLKITPDEQDKDITKIRYKLVTSMHRLFGMAVATHIKGDVLWVKMKTIKAPSTGEGK